MGGFDWALSDPLWFTKLTSFQFQHGPDYVLHWEGKRSAYWFSLPAHILFPQRTVMHAYPLTISCLIVVCQAISRDVEGQVYCGKKKETTSGEEQKEQEQVTDAGDEKVVGDKVLRKRGKKGNQDEQKQKPIKKRKPSDKIPLTSKHNPMGLFLLAGLLVGLIPLMQPHSFISVGLVVLVAVAAHFLEIVFLVFKFPGKNEALLVRVLKQWIVFGIVAFSLGLPQFFKHFFHRVTFGSGKGQGFVRFASCWDEEGKGEGPVLMWWRALGLFVPLFLSSPLVIRTKQQAWFFVGFVCLFVVCNVVMFQPWHLDNTKLFYVWVFGASGFVGLVLHRLMSVRLKIPDLQVLWHVFCWLIFGSLIFSGSLACWREEVNKAKVFDDVDFEYAEWLTQNTNQNAVIMTSLESNPPHIRAESSLAGRQIVYGYEGWLHSHGIDYGNRKQDLDGIMKGSRNGAIAFSRHNIDYVTVESDQENKWNLDFLNEISFPVATNGRYTLYQVNEDMKTFQAEECGFNGITPKQCRQKGCWYMEGASGPWCQKKPKSPKPVACQPDKSGKGIQFNCRHMGCIWDADAEVQCRKSKWLLDGHVISTMRTSVFEAKAGSDCGWSSITPQMCVMRGCAWRRPAVERGPWCVFK